MEDQDQTTDKELYIAQRVAYLKDLGWSNQRIAETLNISTLQVRQIIAGIIAKALRQMGL